MRSTVKKLADTLGNVTATIKRTTPGAYDPTTSTNATATTSSTVLKVIPEMFATREVDGDKVQVGDLKIHFSPADVSTVPQNDDVVTIYGSDYRVVNVQRINFKGSDALYTLHVRRS